MATNFERYQSRQHGFQRSKGSFWLRALIGGPTLIAPMLLMPIAMATPDVTSDRPTAPSAAQLAQATPLEITDIRLDDTGDGLQVQLETTGELPTSITSNTGNALTIEIPNATLALPGDDEFLEFEPANGIAVVQVNALPGNIVRMSITGTQALPVVDINTDSGLAIAVTPGIPQANAGDEAIQIGVTGENENDYIVPDATTATRTDSPLRDIPQSIQVIPRQIIEDEQATGIEDVLDNIAGVTYQGNDDGRGTQFTIRGFGNFGSPILRDGFRVFNGGNNAAAPEVANLERIEVLKGPASVLYGQADPGGLINLVTKQPLFEPYYNFSLQAGNREIFSPAIDFSGPINADGSLRYRLNALYRTEESFRGFENNYERLFAAPTIVWDISDRTTLRVSAEYVHDDDPADFGIPALGDGIADVPLDRIVLSDPQDSVEKEYFSAGYTLEHKFNDNWQIRNEFRYVADNYFYDLIAVPLAIDDEGNVNRILAAQQNERDNYSLYTNIQGKFNTGSIKHNLLFGVDLSREEDLGGGRGAFDPRVGPEFFDVINIFDPVRSGRRPDVDSSPTELINDETVDRLGIYLQDQIYITDNLIVLAGLRYDSVDQSLSSTTRSRVDGTVLASSENEQYDDAVTPRIGIVYQPSDTIALYASYAQSFTPNSGTDIDGNVLEPETGEGFEVGVKADIIPDRLSATLTYFNITRQNVATADPNDPLLQASIATGEQRSQGVELDISGEILPGWNIIASYAYINAEITEDNTFEVGNRRPGIPEHSASLWTTYRIQSGDLEGLGFGLGFNYVGNRKIDLDNTFEAEDYFLTSAAAFYKRDNWQIQVNIDNLFDIDYIESAEGGQFRGIYPGDPLTVRASLSVTF
ncbi:MAG: TonB-dependent receptor [Cyanobacteria bacterium P01_D01_bin.73]